MPLFEYETYLPFSREDVFGWYARPGALVRMHPPFAGRVIEEPTNGVKVGSESTLGINLPGIFGTSLTAVAEMAGGALSLPLRSWVKWRAHHSEYELNRRITDEMVSGPASYWTHERDFVDEGPGMLLRERVTYQLPLTSRLPKSGQEFLSNRFSGELKRIFDFRARQTSEDLAFHQGLQRLVSQDHSSSGGEVPAVRIVAVSGASGLIGRQVCALLSGAGIQVRRLVRGDPPDRAGSEVGSSVPPRIRWDPESGKLDPESLREVDVVIHLAGHPLAARFTDKHKQKVLDSRVDGTDLISRTLAHLEREDGRGRALVSGSAIGFYGATPDDRDHDEETLTETHSRGHDFLAEVCQQWEHATVPAQQAGVRVAIIRTGIVQSPAGGVLEQMLPLFAVGVGGPLGDEQWQSWISIDDIASLIVHMALNPSAEGPVNGVAPEPVTAKQYAQTLAAVMRRPAAVPVPSFGPRLLLGEQGAKELAQANQRVSADKAMSCGYAYRHPTLEDALRHLLGR